MANTQIPVTKTAVIEDSITHQAGDGLTANFSPSMETPDIFDNTAQAVTKKVTEKVPAETVTLAHANDTVTSTDITTKEATVTTPNPNINPNGVSELEENASPQVVKANAVPRQVESEGGQVIAAKTAVVEDSIAYQAGDGMTANFSPSMETPDIFDNSPQAVVKQQTAIVSDNAPQAVAIQETVQRVTPQISDGSQASLQASTQPLPNLKTLSDGSVDIIRED